MIQCFLFALTEQIFLTSRFRISSGRITVKKYSCKYVAFSLWFQLKAWDVSVAIRSPKQSVEETRDRPRNSGRRCSSWGCLFFLWNELFFNYEQRRNLYSNGLWVCGRATLRRLEASMPGTYIHHIYQSQSDAVPFKVLLCFWDHRKQCCLYSLVR